VYAIGQDIFVVDDTSVDYSAPATGISPADGDMDSGVPQIPGEGGEGGNGTNSSDGESSSYTFLTNGLYLNILGITNGIASLTLNNATDMVYEIFSTVSLTNPVWNIEQEVWALTNQTWTPFTVNMLDRTNSLYFWARDWSGITSNGNQTPEYWFYWFYGTTALLDGQSDSSGQNSLLTDFQFGVDPNVIYFAVNVTNQDFNNSYATVQLTVSGGIPSYMAAVVDSLDYSTANWTPYNSNLVVNLGTVEGWHTVSVGLRGLPPNAQQTWNQIQLKLVLTPPVLIITNPMPGLITQPIINLQGFTVDNLARISYDLSNTNSVATNQQAFVTTRFFDTNNLEYTTNGIECFNIALAIGTNTIRLRATDSAGNVTLTNLIYNFDPTANTNPPVINVSWPQDNALISGTNFPVRGIVNDPFAVVSAQIVNAGGSNAVKGLVEQNGCFWIENVPLGAGSNRLTITATNALGYGSATNIAVVQSSVALTIGSVSFNDPWSPTATVGGTLVGSTDMVWVNGVQATDNGDSTWTASYVPVGDSGTATITAAAVASGGPSGGFGPASMVSAADSSGGLGGADAQIAQDVVRGSAVALVDCTWNVSSQYQVSQYGDNFSYPCYGIWDYFDTDTGNSPMHWSYGSPGYNLYSYCYIIIEDKIVGANGNSFTNTTYDYEMTTWDANGNSTLFYVGGDVCGATDGAVSAGSPPATFLPNFGEIASWQCSDLFYSWQYLDQQHYVLNTGGQAVPGQQNIWVIHVWAASEAVGQCDAPGPLIPPNQITVNGQALDANYNAYFALPDNTEVDITPHAPGAAYMFSVNATKYTAQIQANGVALDPVLTNATFCVGQQINFKLGFSPSLSFTNQLCEWTLPPTFVNSSTTNSAGCIKYTNDSSLLVTTTNSCANWYVNGPGGAVNVGASMLMPNGHSVSIAALGQFAIYRPQLTSLVPSTNIAIVLETNNSPNIYMGVGGSMNQKGGMQWNLYVSVNTNFQGQATYVQLLNQSYSWDEPYLLTGITHYDTTDNEYWLDNTYPYLAAGPFPVAGAAINLNWNFGDSPDISGPLYSFADCIDIFKTYVCFQPNGGIPVTIGRVDWAWNGMTVLSNGIWSLTISNIVMPTLDGADDTFPQWPWVYTNK